MARRSTPVNRNAVMAEQGQLDLFPERPIIEILDPRQTIGPATAVQDLARVRIRPSESPHLVFHDRHGWYCETHGPRCPSVSLAQAELR